jgi:Tfp pilus assembly PilM family ATPase
MEKAGVKPTIVDVLPVAIANAFWAGTNDLTSIAPHVTLHFSNDACTLVVDGNGSPFYTRNIYFSVSDVFKKEDSAVNDKNPERIAENADRERSRRLTTLAEEVRRSLSFYEKNNGVSGFGPIRMLGEEAGNLELAETITERVGLPTEQSVLMDRFATEVEVPRGKFDLAMSLAMRTD